MDSGSHPRFQPGYLESLMVGYQKGNGAATSELIETLSPQLFQFYLGQVRDRGRAEDLLQDLWLRIHSARHTYRSSEPLLPWLYSIARRVRIDQYRRTRSAQLHETQVELLPERAAAPPEQPPPIDLEPLLNQLPESQREIVLMLKVSGLSLEEAARATRNSVGSVKQKAHRAYLKLRSLIEDQRATQKARPGHAGH